MNAICVACHEPFQVETFTWAQNKVTGEEALGRDPNTPKEFSPWYGREKWMHADVEEFEVAMEESLCADCDQRRYEAISKASELCSPCQPSWFDPANAGESWDEI